MFWFFEILGIEPTKDKTAIKQAYSKLAHDTNPEDDPDGYAKLHEAYRAALDYASDKVVPYAFVEEIEDPDEQEESEKPKFDFSSVRPDNPALALEIGEILIQIEKLKNESKTNSFADLFKRSDIELCETAVELFKLYSALVVKEDDMFMWDVFFEEPLIKVIIKEQKFRSFIMDGFPEGDTNRQIIERHVDAYEQSVFDTRQRKKFAKQAEEEKARTVDIWIYIAIPIVLFTLVFLYLGTEYRLEVSYLVAMGLSLSGSFNYFISRYLDASKNQNKDRKEHKYINSGLAIIVFLNIMSWFFFFLEPFRDSSLSIITLILCVISSLSSVGVLVYHIAEQIRYRKTSIK